MDRAIKRQTTFGVTTMHGYVARSHCALKCLNYTLDARSANYLCDASARPHSESTHAHKINSIHCRDTNARVMRSPKLVQPYTRPDNRILRAPSRAQ